MQAMASIRSVFAWLVRNGDMRSLSIRYMYRQSAPARLIGLPSSNKGVVRIAKNTLQSENEADRTRDVEGKSVSVRVDLGGRRFIKIKNKTEKTVSKHN